MTQVNELAALKAALIKIDEGSDEIRNVETALEILVTSVHENIVKTATPLLAELDTKRHERNDDSGYVCERSAARIRSKINEVGVKIEDLCGHKINQKRVTLGGKQGYYVDKDGTRLTVVFDIDSNGNWMHEGKKANISKDDGTKWDRVD